MTPRADLERMRWWRSICLAAGAFGAVWCILGALSGREQFFRSYLASYIFWFGLGIGCLGMLMLHHLVGGAWGDLIRPALEAGAMTLPILAILFIPLLFGLRSIFPWAAPGAASDPLLRHKSLYLNVPFFGARAAVYFTAWAVMAVLFKRWGKGGDTLPCARRLSGPCLVLYVLTLSFCLVDWMMSIEPRSHSTIYSLMVMMGLSLSALAFCILGSSFLGLLPPRRPGEDKPWSDLGNMVLAFVMLWAYTAFSQYLIIWSGDLPTEVSWYAARQNGGWFGVALALILFHFFIPFLLLLDRRTKASPRRLAAVAALLLLLRLLDLHWLLDPPHDPTGLRLRGLDAAALLGVGALWLASFLGHLSRDERLFERAPGRSPA